MTKEIVVYTHTHTHTHTHSHICNSVIKKETEILPFVTTRKDLKGISLSKFSQRKTNSIWPHLQMKSETDKQNQNKKQNWTHREYIGGW